MMKRIILSSMFVLSVLTTLAQTLSSAQSTYNRYTSMVSAGQENATVYNILLQAYEEYKYVIKNSDKGSSDYNQAKSALKEIFGQLQNGAYYFTGLNNEPMTVKMAQKYVELSLLAPMAEENLMQSEGYPLFTFFAGYKSYDSGDYATAVLFLQTYLSTSDNEHREDVFVMLAHSLYMMKNYDSAKYVTNQGIKNYPANENLIKILIQSCLDSNDDTALEDALRKGTNMYPNDTGLLTNLCKLYERRQDYARAAESYKKLDRIMPNDINVYTHMAFNYYNAGIQATANSKAETNKSRASEYKRAADDFFRKAAPLLQDVLDNSPYAHNVAHALAMCHSATGNTAALQQANAVLAQMNEKAVQVNATPMAMDTSYKLSSTPIAAAPVAAPVPAKPKEFESDVDINIPVNSMKNENTYAIIIANENYKYNSKVDYALRDGSKFAEYCNKVLGVPKDNIRMTKDAALSEMNSLVSYMTNKAKMNPGQLNYIFYYAGHGVPNVATGGAYLMPTESNGTDLDITCYQLDKLYAQFNDMNVKSVTVFLDACFSGATRDGGMLFKERFVEYDVEESEAKGNTVVFSATSGKETAMPYDEQQHGFFTYFLLKCLQETKGNITLSDLGRYLKQKVDNKAYDKKNKHQTPTVNPAASLGDSWKTRKLIQ